MKNLKVLVIDDNEPILSMLKLLLERNNYQVTVKENTEALENLLYTLSPDLLIMDVLLSGVDGRDICIQIRKNKDFNKLPILLISALLDAEESCLTSGAQYFMGKPFEMAKFNTTVKTAITTPYNFEVKDFKIIPIGI